MTDIKLSADAGRGAAAAGDADWGASLRAGRFAQAARGARRGGGAALLAALDDLAEVEKLVRDKRYKRARRALSRYAEQLEADHPEASGLEKPGEAETLRGLVNTSAIDAAIAALESAESARLHDPEALRDVLAPALAHPFTAPEAHNVLGVLRALLGENAEARAQFDRVLALDPRHYRALTNVGNLLLEQGEAAQAEGYYRRALELNSEYAGAHHNLAVVLRRQRKLGASVRSLKTSQRLMVRQSNQEGREEARAKLGTLGQTFGGGFLRSRGGRLTLTVVLVGVAAFVLRALGG